ncbi:MAG: hypothetical protein M1819_004352 [Sarea resinae]|nr:MAG: hypothetical protein M1819_004352 [Sarea resinae]
MATLSRGLLQRSVNLDGYICQRCRNLSSSAYLNSGHSRWSTIKHDKGKADAVKNKQRSILAQELTQASKLFGADPNNNPRLATAIQTAKKAGFPKASMEAAISRGQGISLSGAALETLTLEAILPPSVAFVIDCQTDSKARTLQDLRVLIKDFNGTATPTSYLFEKKGRIEFEEAEGISGDDILDDAIEAGASDIVEGPDGSITVFTEPSQTRSVMEALTASSAKLKVDTSEIIWDPNEDTMVGLPSDDAAKSLSNFIDALQEDPSVLGVYANVSQGDVSEGAWVELKSRLGN